MKRLLFTLLFIFAVSPVHAENPCATITPDSITRHVPVSGAIISKRNVNGICEVILKIRQEYVPVYVTPDFVIAGEMFQDKKQITKNIIDKLKEKNFILYRKPLDQCVSMKYTPQGDIKQTIYMITDPECPYCDRAAKKIKKIAGNYQAEVKIILHSVHGKAGRGKVIEAICRNLDFDQYTNKNWIKENKTNEYQCGAGTARLKQTEKIIKKLGITGVPVFYLGGGKKIVGANMPALIKALNSEKLGVADAD